MKTMRSTSLRKIPHVFPFSDNELGFTCQQTTETHINCMKTGNDTQNVNYNILKN